MRKLTLPYLVVISDPEQPPFAGFAALGTALNFALTLRGITTKDIFVVDSTSGKVESRLTPFPAED